MTRRHLLTVGGATLAGSFISDGSRAAAPPAIALEIPPLPYPPEALEPHIDAVTMTLHHEKHHSAYLANLKVGLEAAKLTGEDVVKLIQNLATIPEEQREAVRNHGGGHVNHTWFWNWLAPARSGPRGPEGKLGEAIQSSFGSIEAFRNAFAEAGAKQFGSGWAWLIVDGSGKLAVVSTANQDNPLMKGVVPEKEQGMPVLGLDVWEHAYYLKYQNKRPDYITAWWNVVNWEAVAKSYASAKPAS